MAKGTVNKVILIGRLGHDPDVRHMPTGNMVVNFSMATIRTWKDAGGQQMEVTDWHKITLFGKLAELAKEYCFKGQRVYVEGRQYTNKWEKDGQTHYSTSVVAEALEMLSFKDDKNQTSAPSAENQPEAESVPDDVPF